MSDAFKVGDIVRLKSGGPEMTVVEHNTPRSSVETAWFVGEKKESAYFPPESLMHAKSM